jgi:hypothetical protein
MPGLLEVGKSLRREDSVAGGVEERVIGVWS